MGSQQLLLCASSASGAALRRQARISRSFVCDLDVTSSKPRATPGCQTHLRSCGAGTCCDDLSGCMAMGVPMHLGACRELGYAALRLCGGRCKAARRRRCRRTSWAIRCCIVHRSRVRCAVLPAAHRLHTLRVLLLRFLQFRLNDGFQFVEFRFLVSQRLIEDRSVSSNDVRARDPGAGEQLEDGPVGIGRHGECESIGFSECGYLLVGFLGVRWRSLRNHLGCSSSRPRFRAAAFQLYTERTMWPIG